MVTKKYHDYLGIIMPYCLMCNGGLLPENYNGGFFNYLCGRCSKTIVTHIETTYAEKK